MAITTSAENKMIQSQLMQCRRSNFKVVFQRKQFNQLTPIIILTMSAMIGWFPRKQERLTWITAAKKLPIQQVLTFKYLTLHFVNNNKTSYSVLWKETECYLIVVDSTGILQWYLDVNQAQHSPETINASFGPTVCIFPISLLLHTQTKITHTQTH